MTYDVVMVAPGGRRAPLTVGTRHIAATEIAQARSRDAHWDRGEVRETASGRLVSAWENGKRVSP